ncbi:hypothetical protein [Microcoleus sp. D2_18a_D3]|uniref:hypothetical protein n=1 Tax=Microcoleus sp. D2_18a_D3 TaxID=3055330 RepID=UPI002FCE86AF
MQVAPAEIFTGYTSDGTNITIPLASLPGLTAEEANATTGNVMEVSRQILDRLHSGITALAPTARPTKATVAKQNPSIATGANIAPGTLRQGYTLTFDLTPTALELAAEA